MGREEGEWEWEWNKRDGMDLDLDLGGDLDGFLFNYCQGALIVLYWYNQLFVSLLNATMYTIIGLAQAEGMMTCS